MEIIKVKIYLLHTLCVEIAQRSKHSLESQFPDWRITWYKANSIATLDNTLPCN